MQRNVTAGASRESAQCSGYKSWQRADLGLQPCVQWPYIEGQHEENGLLMANQPRTTQPDD